MASHRYIADKVKFKMRGGMAHITFTTGSEDWEFTTQACHFMAAARRANNKIAAWQADNGQVIRLKRVV
jgi:hypothetical protein